MGKWQDISFFLYERKRGQMQNRVREIEIQKKNSMRTRQRMEEGQKANKKDNRKKETELRVNIERRKHRNEEIVERQIEENIQAEIKKKKDAAVFFM